MRKKTHEEFVEEVRNIVGDEYSVLGDYRGANIHTTMKHNKCGHIYNVKPSNFLTGKRCPQCNKPTYNLESAKNQFKKVGFTLLATEYTGALNDMPYVCNTHRDLGVQYASLSAINQGHTNCPKCRYRKTAESQRIDRKTIIQDFKNAGLILQPDFTYDEIHDALPCICEKHTDLGIQYISYSNIKYGGQKGCVRCGYERLGDNKRMSDDEIKGLVEALDLEFVAVIKERKTKVEVICPKHREQGVQIKTLDKIKLGQGCKHCNYSHGEREVEVYLKSHNIDNVPQKTFDGLKGCGGGLLSYDFYVPICNTLIEFNGLQHYKPVDCFGGMEYFKIQKEHDKRKREFALKNNIELLEISYKDIDNVENILKQKLCLN